MTTLPHTARPTPPPETPAARLLAEIEHVGPLRRVHLPPRLASAALERFFRIYHRAVVVFEGPMHEAALGRAITAAEWAFHTVYPPNGAPPLRCFDESFQRDIHRVFVAPRHTILLEPEPARHLLRALEDIKPEELDARGLPLAWVPPRPSVAALGARAAASDGDDDVFIATGPLPAATADTADATSDGDAAPDLRPTITTWLAELCALAAVPTPELTLTRARDNRLGFCAGKIWLTPARHPLRVHMTLCPNADHAEILATLVHEVAHATRPTGAHDLDFKRALVDLAARRFAEPWFSAARAHLDDSYRVVDAWLASGIRAALRRADPPAPRVTDDGLLAKTLMRINKLRALAQNQLGLPEGITATATANDLVVAHGLESYAVRIEGDTHDQLVDLWVQLEDGATWRRTLAHAVATYCDVFSLVIAKKDRMHFFGRHADVVAAEYLYSVSAARIERECAAHLVAFKARARRSSGETRSEKASFCHSAAAAFEDKLEHMKRLESDELDLDRGLHIAEDFARSEHEKRGRSWGSGGTRTYRANAAGHALGDRMEILRGVGAGATDRPKGLPHR